MRICGVDPGLRTTGYGVLEVVGGLIRVVDAGTIRPTSNTHLELLLAGIFQDLVELLTESKPDVVAVENFYSPYPHPQTPVKMGHVRGVILLAAANCSLPVRQYPATQIKKALTGNGRAGKSQIQQAVQAQLGLATFPEPHDVADALAIALCDINSETSRATGGASLQAREKCEK